jgi:drug/metabolite transporter (DMT)-like permease
MLTYLLAVLAACANAASWVLQRKANREVPQQDNMSWKLIRDLLHKPVWFGGILAITIGFLLQATALGYGGLAVVEPILVLELPLTLILGARVFRTPLGPREWLPTVAMSAGVAGLLFFLSPTPGQAGGSIQWYVWVAAIGANLGLVALLVVWGRRGPAGHSDGRRGNSAEQAAVLGVAAGSAFGLTAALMKGMTATYAGGLGHLLSSWQLYAMAATGVLGMFLTQSALNAGRLIAAQPGLTLTDPIISVLWGVLVFGEQARGGVYIVPQVAALGVIAVAVTMLARSPLLDEHEPAQAPMVTASQ